jgi:hypothetical protein
MFSRLRRFFTHPGTGFRAPARIFWTGLIVRVLYIAIAHTYRIRLILDHFQFGWETGRIARALATGGHRTQLNELHQLGAAETRQHNVHCLVQHFPGLRISWKLTASSGQLPG